MAPPDLALLSQLGQAGHLVAHPFPTDLAPRPASDRSPPRWGSPLPSQLMEAPAVPKRAITAVRGGTAWSCTGHQQRVNSLCIHANQPLKRGQGPENLGPFSAPRCCHLPWAPASPVKNHRTVGASQGWGSTERTCWHHHHLPSSAPSSQPSVTTDMCLSRSTCAACGHRPKPHTLPPPTQ